VGMEFEAKAESSGPEFQAALKKQHEKTASEGLSAIEFTGADREKWLKAATDAGWAEVFERSAEHGPALKKLFSKN
jgi:hypothetical protein